MPQLFDPYNFLTLMDVPRIRLAVGISRTQFSASSAKTKLGNSPTKLSEQKAPDPVMKLIAIARPAIHMAVALKSMAVSVR